MKNITRQHNVKENLQEENLKLRRRIDNLEKQLRKNSYPVKTSDNINQALKYTFEGIAFINTAGEYLFVNPPKAKLLGYKEEELLHLNWLQTIHPEDRQDALACYQKMKIRGKAIFEGRAYKKDGTIFYKELTLLADYDQEGRFKGNYSFLRDITEKKLAEEKIKEAQQFIQQIAKASPNIIAVFDLKINKLIYVNGVIKQHLGFTPDQLIGLDAAHISAFISPEDQQMLKKEIQRLHHLKPQEIIKAEFRIKNSQDDFKWYDCRFGLFKNDELKPGSQQVILVASDISQGKRNESLLSGILNSSMSGIAAFKAIRDEKAHIKNFEWLLMNDTTARINKVQKNAFIGKTLKQTYPENLSRKYFKEFVNVVETGKPYHAEDYQKFNESVGWFELEAAKYQDGFVLTFNDISSRKEAEEELINKNQMLTGLLNNLPIVLSKATPEGILLEMNGSGLANIGLENQAVKGHDILKYFPGLNNKIKLVLEGKPQYFIEAIDNEKVRNFIYNNFYFDQSTQRIIGISIDITGQIMAEEAFKQEKKLNKQLKKWNNVMDTFLHATAHDLKSPVNNLKMLLTFINQSKTQPLDEAYLKGLNTSVKRLDQTINGLVEVIEVQSMDSTNYRHVNFNEMLTKARKQLDQEILQSKAEITTDFSEAAAIFYVESYLLSILINLLENAIKYRDNQRNLKIDIRTFHQDNFKVLAIKDNGMGMELNKYGKNLFKPFKRFSANTEGTGMGLHLIKSIVEKNNGKIEINSKINSGTQVYVYLKDYESK